MSGARTIHLNAFDMTCVGHQSPGLWRHPDDQSYRYKDLEYWTDLARLLERGCFDSLFIADVLGAYDVYQGSADAAVTDGAQIPVNDPMLAVSAMASRTVGEVFTELSAGDSSLGQVPQNHFFFVNVLAHAGTAEQERFFYTEVLRGKRFGNALAERGSKTAHDFKIAFTPQYDGSYLLDGTKYYSTGSVFAHWIPVYANDPQGRLHAAWVPADARGVMVIDDWNGMGQRTTGSGTVVFSKVSVPPDHVVPAHLIFEKTDTAALTVSSEIFALIGSRSTMDDLNLNRHWRNARTHTLHDPRRWKIRHIGDWELNDTPPPRNGII